MKTILAVLIIGVCLVGCGEPAKKPTDKSAEVRLSNAIPIRAIPVGEGTVVETLSAQGRLEVWQRVILSPKVSGVVEDVPVLQNQEVKKDDVILRLLAPIADVEASLRAEAKLKRATRDLERRLELQKTAPETISIADLDLARDALNDAQLEVDLYNHRKENLVLKAPFAGVLLMPPSTAAANTQPIIPGQQVSEGTPVAELLDLTRYRLNLDLPETNLRRLAVGQAVEITAIADGATATGTIASLPEAIDATKGSGRVLVDISQPPTSWRPGGFVTAQLVLGETKAPLVLARDTVLYRENRPYVWVAEEHEGVLVVRRAWVDLGPGDSKQIIVTKGVTAGERVVTEGMNGLSDGVPVTIRDQAAAEPTVADPEQ